MRQQTRDGSRSTQIENIKRQSLYKAARQLVRDVYLLQNQFPKEERYALGDQVRRAATSITANLAEGSGRQSPKEKIHFTRDSLWFYDRSVL